MSVNNLCFKSIGEIQDYTYHIDKYQRRYRWKMEQVEKLLDDLLEFMDSPNNDTFYCLQPIVMYKNSKRNKTKSDYLYELEQIEENQFPEKAIELLANKNEWDIVDGQQRLNTISLILNALDGKTNITILTESRNDKNNFGFTLDEIFKERNKETIKRWIENNLKNEEKRNKFAQLIMNRVKVIWYEINEEPDVVYNRLNTGKIPLTDAELIKALLLCSNQKNNGKEDIGIKQTEIATGWNNIEYKLRDNSFFFFLFSPENDNNSRMDVMCRIIYDYQLLDKEKLDEEKRISSKQYSSYPVFNYILDKKKYLKDLKRDVWDDIIMELFNTFLEWYNDVELYHYIGYLIATNEKNVGRLYQNWITKKSKSQFLDSLKEVIYEKLKNRVNDDSIEKSRCRDILLFHNIQTAIQMNKSSLKQDTLNPFSYRFPFDLFKKEKWDVEHIEPEMPCDFTKTEDQKAYVNCFSTLSVNESNEQKNDTENKTDISFNDFLKEHPLKVELSEGEKNSLKNYVLLDYKTNRSYQNSIFPVKRRIIAEKDMGTSKKENNSTFIPPCTRNVFMKYYSSLYREPTVWTREDANNYLKDIKRMVEMIKPQKNEEQTNNDK